MNQPSRPKLRVIVTALLGGVGLVGCSGGGIDAGIDGGLAFIAFAVMLILTVVILYIALGRD